MLLCFCTLTGEDNEENDCDVDEEELEVPEVAEDLTNKSEETSWETPLKSNIFYLQPTTANTTIITECSNTHRVEQSHSNVLDHAVEGHELEHAEGGDEGSAALPVKNKQKKSKNNFSAYDGLVKHSAV